MAVRGNTKNDLIRWHTSGVPISDSINPAWKSSGAQASLNGALGPTVADKGPFTSYTMMAMWSKTLANAETVDGLPSGSGNGEMAVAADRTSFEPTGSARSSWRNARKLAVSLTSWCCSRFLGQSAPPNRNLNVKVVLLYEVDSCFHEQRSVGLSSPGHVGLVRTCFVQSPRLKTKNYSPYILQHPQALAHPIK